jgi:hypothetical protein
MTTRPTIAGRDFRVGVQADADATHQLLRVARLTADLHYDGDRIVTIGHVRACFTAHGVEITFPDPYGDPDDDTPVAVTVAYPYTFGAIVTVIEGLFRTVTP